MDRLLKELRRRNVFRIATAYGVIAWLIVQVAAIGLPAFSAPGWVLRTLIVTLVVLFPIAVFCAWRFAWTPAGLTVRSTSGDAETEFKQLAGLDYALLILLVGALSVAGFQLIVRDDAQSPLSEPASQQGSTPQFSPNSIAILPFRDLSPGGDHAFFANGLAAEILNYLTRVDELDVTSRTSSFTYQDTTDADIGEIASDLQVRHILEGTVRTSGDRIRVTAMLIDTQRDALIWSRTFDDTLATDNVFAMQETIAQNITQALGGSLPDGGLRARLFAAGSTENITAYRSFLRGYEIYISRQSRRMAEMLEHFEQAVLIDPEFAAGWEALAAGYTIAPGQGLRDRDYPALARNAAARGLAISPNLALARAVEANSPDYSDAETLDGFAEAIEIDPGHPVIRDWRSQYWTRLGFFEAAEDDARACLDIDPDQVRCRSSLYMLLSRRGAVEEALSIRDWEEFATWPSQPAHLVVGLFLAQEEYAAAEQVFSDWAAPDHIDLGRLLRSARQPQFDFDTEAAAYREEWEIAFGHSGWWTAKQCLFRQFDAWRDSPGSASAGSMHWFCLWPEFQSSNTRDELIQRTGAPVYWRERGYPPHCRPRLPTADNRFDFECD